MAELKACDIIKNYPVLWDNDDPNFGNIYVKAKAKTAVLHEYNEQVPNHKISVNMLTRKIRNFQRVMNRKKKTLKVTHKTSMQKYHNLAVTTISSVSISSHSKKLRPPITVKEEQVAVEEEITPEDTELTEIDESTFVVEGLEKGKSKSMYINNYLNNGSGSKEKTQVEYKEELLEIKDILVKDRISGNKTCTCSAMDPGVLEKLLKAIGDAVSDRHRGDDVELPPFDPAENENGVESWCSSINSIAEDLGWSSVTTVAKAGKALKGSALLWYETWDPEEGRTWEAFRTTIKYLYPEKLKLSDKLAKAVLLDSDTTDSYCEYAREKLRLLKNTKVAFTEHQLVELICGGIADINVRTASYNSNVKTTAELISLFKIYAKNPRKRPLNPGNKSSGNPDSTTCKKSGHTH